MRCWQRCGGVCPIPSCCTWEKGRMSLAHNPRVLRSGHRRLPWLRDTRWRGLHRSPWSCHTRIEGMDPAPCGPEVRIRSTRISIRLVPEHAVARGCDRSGLDLRALMPFVEAGDPDPVWPGVDRGAPSSVIVLATVPPLRSLAVPRSHARVDVARSHRRREEQPMLRAKPPCLGPVPWRCTPRDRGCEVRVYTIAVRGDGVLQQREKGKPSRINALMGKGGKGLWAEGGGAGVGVGW